MEHVIYQVKHIYENHNNHTDKTILEFLVEMLKCRTQTSTIYKVKAHTNIDRDEQLYILAKTRTKRICKFLPNHMSLHILQHTTFKKTYGQAQEKK